MLSLQSALVLGVLGTVAAVPHGGWGRPQHASPPPLPSSDLPAPDGLNLKVITIGVGHQNYTCNATSGTYSSNVALASLFDATQYLTRHPDQVDTISAERLEQYEEADECEDDADFWPWLRQIGEHYFQDTTPPIPNFNLYELNAFLSAKKDAGVPAPDSSNVDWLKLVDNGNGETHGLKAVYRVETAGGKPPTSCSGDEQIFVPYAAQYWFYD